MHIEARSRFRRGMRSRSRDTVSDCFCHGFIEHSEKDLENIEGLDCRIECEGFAGVQGYRAAKDGRRMSARPGWQPIPLSACRG